MVIIYQSPYTLNLEPSAAYDISMSSPPAYPQSESDDAMNISVTNDALVIPKETNSIEGGSDMSICQSKVLGVRGHRTKCISLSYQNPQAPESLWRPRAL